MNRHKLIIRNAVGLLLAVVICIYAFASGKAIAAKEEEGTQILKNESNEPIKYRQIIDGRHYYAFRDEEMLGREYILGYVSEEFWVEEGEVFTYKLPMETKNHRPLRTERVLLNNEPWDNLSEISYVVHGENTITYSAYNDYNIFYIKYVDEENNYLATDSFFSKDGELITWRIDFNRVPGYEVKEIRYWKYKQPLKEVITFYYGGSYYMTVIMVGIKDEDVTPPDIYAGDVYFPVKFANSGRLSYDYLMNLFAATDDRDGLLDSIDHSVVNGYYIEGYNEEAFIKATGDAIVVLRIVAVDKAGNRRGQDINCYLVDTEAEHIGDGKKKRFRFTSDCSTVIKM